MERRINTRLFTDEQLRDYHLAIKARMAELAIYDANCQEEWDIRYPQE